MLYRVGARRWIARIMMSWGIATAAMVFVHAEWQFYVLRFIIGAMEAGFAPGVLYYLTLWFPASIAAASPRCCSWPRPSPASSARRSRADAQHLTACSGWRAGNGCFLAGGLPCIALGCSCCCSRTASRTQLADRAEKELLAGDQPDRRTGQSASARSAGAAMPGFLMLGLIYFLIQVASYGLNFWAPELIGRPAAAKPAMIGFLTAMPYICGAIAWW